MVTKDNTRILKVEFKPKVVVIDFATVENEVVNNGRTEFLIKQKPFHPDFTKAMNNMAFYLGAVHYYEDYKDIVSVNSCQLVDDKEGDKIKIKGNLLLESSNSVKIESDNILIVDNKFNEFGDLKVDADTLWTEAYKYCFENKVSQLEIPFDNNNSKTIDNEPIIDDEEAF